MDLQRQTGTNVSPQVRDWIADIEGRLGIKHPSQWYDIELHILKATEQTRSDSTPQDFPSLLDALKAAHPNHEWDTFKFKEKRNLWTPATKRSAFDAAMKFRGMQDLSDWYRISRRDMYDMGLGGILSNFYNNSPQQALADVYPHHKWLPWKFKLTRRVWENVSNRNQFLQWAADELGVTKMEDWYQVSVPQISSLDGGSSLVAYFGGSLPSAIMVTMSHHTWLPWLFNPAPRALFENADQRRRYMEWLGKQLGFSRMEDWYTITKVHFEKNKGASLLAHSFGNSARRAAMETFPDHSWLPSRFGASSEVH
jgi:hypothetical protein